jgi:hypothetical protein
MSSNAGFYTGSIMVYPKYGKEQDRYLILDKMTEQERIEYNKAETNVVKCIDPSYYAINLLRGCKLHPLSEDFIMYALKLHGYCDDS